MKTPPVRPIRIEFGAMRYGAKRRLGGLAAVALGLLAAAGPARAGGSEDLALIEAGRALAEQNCARCHAIRGPGPGPVAEAPPFSRFARAWPIGQIAEALAEGIVTGHGPVKMPEFAFSPRQIDALLAYLVSVQE